LKNIQLVKDNKKMALAEIRARSLTADRLWFGPCRTTSREVDSIRECQPRKAKIVRTGGVPAKLSGFIRRNSSVSQIDLFFPLQTFN
jgi:hypothetical protein